MAGKPSAALAGALALALCLAACSGNGSHASSTSRPDSTTSSLPVSAPGGPALLTSVSSDIHDARLTRPVVIDGGLLQLNPPTAPPGMTESRAIHLFRANGGHAVAVRVHPLKLTAVVAYAIVTVRLAVPRDPTLVIQPRAFPVFDHRPAWVIIGSQSGPCERAVGKSTAPASESLELIASDASGEGLVYNTAGSVCGFPEKPKVDVAAYRLRLPWVVVSLTGTRLVLRHAAPPSCSDSEGGATLTGPTSETITIGAYVAMERPPCKTPPRTLTDIEYLGPKQQLLHGPTGLEIGPTLGSRTFTYFDGTSHTIA